MTPERIHTATGILMKCSAYDNRKPDPATIAAWAEALDPDITLDDGLRIVRDHYAESRDWIMPADINRRSRDIRRQRVANVLENRLPIPDGLGDEPHLEIAWRKAFTRAIGDGLDLDTASAAAWQHINRTPPPQLPATRHNTHHLTTTLTHTP